MNQLNISESSDSDLNKSKLNKSQPNNSGSSPFEVCCSESNKIDQIIKEKFESGIFSMEFAPCILYMDNSGVYINKFGPFPSEIESLEKSVLLKDYKVRNKKLKAKCYGCWLFHIELIKSKYFESKEIFDTYVIDLRLRSISKNCKNYGRISVKNALELLGIELSCNMNYYLQNQKKMESDLKRPISAQEISDKNLLKNLENELFYEQMCKIFGRQQEQNCDNKNEANIYFLNEFHILSSDGNTIFASASLGDYYLCFFFDN